MKLFKTYTNSVGRHYTYVGRYKVVQESKKFNGIYLNGQLITSSMTWRRAIKLAELLCNAFEEGKDYERDDYNDNWND